MKPKMILRLSVDLAMTLLLPVQMAFQITGQASHEWTGAAMIALFLTHNILNVRWYKNLFKGAYTPIRIFQTTINLLLLVSVLSLAVSGALMSAYVFRFLPIRGGIAFARLLHLAASYWAFVLMGMHMGLHWGMIMKRIPQPAFPVPRIIALMIAGYGACTFYKANIASYMFLINQFAFLDYEKSPVLVFAEYSAMMGLWICAAYYAAKLIKKGERPKNNARRTA